VIHKLVIVRLMMSVVCQMVGCLVEHNGYVLIWGTIQMYTWCS